MIEDKECPGGSKKGRACLVLGVRKGFTVKLNLGELCKGYRWDMRSEMAFLSRDTM